MRVLRREIEGATRLLWAVFVFMLLGFALHVLEDTGTTAALVEPLSPSVRSGVATALCACAIGIVRSGAPWHAFVAGHLVFEMAMYCMCYSGPEPDDARAVCLAWLRTLHVGALAVLYACALLLLILKVDDEAEREVAAVLELEP